MVQTPHITNLVSGTGVTGRVFSGGLKKTRKGKIDVDGTRERVCSTPCVKVSGDGGEELEVTFRKTSKKKLMRFSPFFNGIPL